MNAKRHEALIEAASITRMLDLPQEGLVRIWNEQNVGFPEPMKTEPGPLWSRRAVEEWARAYGWPV